MKLPKYDFVSDNFVNYFLAQIKGLTSSQKEKIPEVLRLKLYSKSDNEKFVVGRSNSLTIFQRLFILWRVMRKKIYIVIEDEDNGLSIEDFIKAKEWGEGRTVNEDRAGWLISQGHFVLGNKDLCEAFHYMQMISVSSAYKYLLTLKNLKPTKYHNYKVETDYIHSLIMNYESRKKLISRNAGVTVPEWYVLLYFSDGKEKGASSIYTGQYFNSHNASRMQLLNAIKSMVDRGFLTKYGKTFKATYIISPYGLDKLYEITSKYVIS